VNSNIIPQIHLGKGDTVFHTGKRGGYYFIEFRLLEKAGDPGEITQLANVMNAKPYFVITISEFKSLKVLAQTIVTLYKSAKKRLSEAPHD